MSKTRRIFHVITLILLVYLTQATIISYESEYLSLSNYCKG